MVNLDFAIHFLTLTRGVVDVLVSFQIQIWRPFFDGVF